MGRRTTGTNAKGILSVPVVNYYKNTLTSIVIRILLPEGVFSANDVINVEYNAVTIR